MSKRHQNIVHIARGRFVGASADSKAVIFNGQNIAVTDSNRNKVEEMLQRDAELAYAAAANGRDYRSTIAIAA